MPRSKQFKFKESTDHKGIEIWAEDENKSLLLPNELSTSLLGHDDNM